MPLVERRDITENDWLRTKYFRMKKTKMLMNNNDDVDLLTNKPSSQPNGGREAIFIHLCWFRLSLLRVRFAFFTVSNLEFYWFSICMLLKRDGEQSRRSNLISRIANRALRCFSRLLWMKMFTIWWEQGTRHLQRLFGKWYFKLQNKPNNAKITTR